MSDEIPQGDTYNELPKFLVIPQAVDGDPAAGTGAEREFRTDDPEEANHAAHKFARERNGVFVAIYQRVGMVRKRT